MGHGLVGCCAQKQTETLIQAQNIASMASNPSRRKQFLEKTKETYLNSFYKPDNQTINIDNNISFNDRENEFKFTTNKCKCGENCKEEDWMTQTNPYIVGINSSKITSNLIASQRPSTCLMKHYSLIKQFKFKNIAMIINLQREGEHPNCGPQKKLEPSCGFSYLPEDFIIEDIECKVFGWRDLNAPGSFEFVLQIVKEIGSVVEHSNKKVS